MASALHLHPDRLRRHAATAAALADELRATGGGSPPAGSEGDRLRAAVRRTGAELAELGSVLAGAATAAERADQVSAQALHRRPRVPGSSRG